MSDAVASLAERRGTVLRHLALALFAAVVLFPFFWILAASFQRQIDLRMGPVLTSYQSVLFGPTSDYVRNFANSMIIGIGSTLLVLTVATLAAWSLYRMDWPEWCSSRC